MNKNYAFVFLILLAMPLAFAIPQGNGVLRNGQIDAVMADVNCKSAFNTGVLQSYLTAIPNSSSVISTFTDKINSDTQQLSAYASANDTTNFRTFLRDTYEKDSKDAKTQLAQLRRGANLSNETRASLRSEYDQLKQTYDSCHFDAVKSFTMAKVDSYDHQLSDFDSKINDLESKGIDVSGMRSLVSDARSTILDPLRNSLNDANNASQLRLNSRQYCMFDGCGNGTDFHLAAKFEIEKLTSMLNKIKESNMSSNYSSNINAEIAVASGYLQSAKAALDDLNNGKYSDESRSQVWDNIKNSADEIKLILKDIRQERIDTRRAQIGQRMGGMQNGTENRIGGMRNQTMNGTRRMRGTRFGVNQSDREDNRSSDDSGSGSNGGSENGRN